MLTKPPQPGVAKTRLIPALGATLAAELARALLLDSWQAACAASWGLPVLAVSAADEELGQLTGARTVWRQGPGDFCQRMERVLGRALSLAPRALVLGSDSPGLPLRLLEQAQAALLAGVEAVLGPADDGGFYLLGLSRCPAGLLAGLRWGDAQTYVRTRARLEQAGLTVTAIEPWFDVDLPLDLLRLEQALCCGQLVAPATARLLDRAELQACLRALPPDRAP